MTPHPSPLGPLKRDLAKRLSARAHHFLSRNPTEHTSSPCLFRECTWGVKRHYWQNRFERSHSRLGHLPLFGWLLQESYQKSFWSEMRGDRDQRRLQIHVLKKQSTVGELKTPRFVKSFRKAALFYPQCCKSLAAIA